MNLIESTVNLNQNIENYGLSKKLSFVLSDTIIISDRYTDSKISNLSKIIRFLKKNKKNVIVLSKSSEFKEYGHMNFFDKYIFSEFIYLNKSQINKKNILIRLKKDKYLDLKKEQYEFMNFRINNIAKQENVLFLNKHDYLCNDFTKECDILTDENFKIYYDYGHYTLEGAKYFGKKIHRMNWLKIN